MNGIPLGDRKRILKDTLIACVDEGGETFRWLSLEFWTDIKNTWENEGIRFNNLKDVCLNHMEASQDTIQLYQAETLGSTYREMVRSLNYITEQGLKIQLLTPEVNKGEG